MVSRCCVPLCKNDGKTKGVSFHNFTKDAKLRKVWIHKIKRDTRKSKNNPCPFQVNKHTKICSKHFVKQDFLIKSEKSRLKSDAVPSIFPWTPTIIRKTAHSQQKIGNVCTSTSTSTTCQTTNTLTEEVDVITLSKTSSSMSGTADRQEDNEQPGESSRNTLSTTTSVNEIINLNSGNTLLVGEEAASSDTVGVIAAATYHTLSAEYKKLLTLYTDLLCEHRTYVKSCRCRIISKVDKSTMAACDPMYKEVDFTAPFFSLEKFQNDDNEIAYYTAFPNYKVLMISFNMLFEYDKATNMKLQYTKGIGERSHQHRLCKQDEYFLVLIKLKLNLGYHHLGTLFNISTSTVGNIFVSWINFIYVRLGSLDIWPHREVLRAHYTDEFKHSYPNVIGSLDATELYIQKPSSLLKQSQTFSHYKNSNTVKGLIAVDANGAVIFASALFTGAISDNALLKSSGFTKLIEEKMKKGFLLLGDTFLADKGFTATELLKPVNISIPVFRVGNVQFSDSEVHHCQKISHERVHVERAIGRLKNYKILACETPLSFIGTFNQVWTVCCLLSNFQMPLRKVKKETTVQC